MRPPWGRASRLVTVPDATQDAIEAAIAATIAETRATVAPAGPVGDELVDGGIHVPRRGQTPRVGLVDEGGVVLDDVLTEVVGRPAPTRRQSECHDSPADDDSQISHLLRSFTHQFVRYRKIINTIQIVQIRTREISSGWCRIRVTPFV